MSFGNYADLSALPLKNMQNVRKFFLNIFLLGFWPKNFLTTLKLIYFLKLVSVKILLKMNAHQKAKQKTYLDVHNKTLSQLYIVSDNMNFLKQNVFTFLFALI